MLLKEVRRQEGKNLPFCEMQKILDALWHHSERFYSMPPNYSTYWIWSFENCVNSEIHLGYSEKQWRKHGFNHVQDMDFLNHRFIKIFKGLSLFRYTGNEMWHYKGPFQCNKIKWKTNIANHNCLYNLAFCDLFLGYLLLRITSKEEMSVRFTSGHWCEYQ